MFKVRDWLAGSIRTKWTGTAWHRPASCAEGHHDHHRVYSKPTTLQPLYIVFIFILLCVMLLLTLTTFSFEHSLYDDNIGMCMFMMGNVSLS